MKVHSPTVKNDLQKRLRRIEGQVRGIHKMVDDERDCQEIIQQLTAVRSAVQNARLQFLREYARECLLQGVELTAGDRAGMVDELINLVGKVE
ncbi:MAG: metal-sensitive transcriptional regulator [Chloroflexi bacterium]|nr:metal-sensitive transcriptional regulator [Chloroflexota bacterium]